MAFLHFKSMLVFQLSYIAWGMASACIFPTAHATLTVVFLGAFLFHWVVSAKIVMESVSAEDDLEADICTLEANRVSSRVKLTG